MWYNTYKEENILINQSSGHNKFWAASWDESNNTVNMRWGRIGTKGQYQVKKFGSKSDAINFISKKVYEKQAKGYSNTINGAKITEAELNKVNTIAAIIGTQNKCSNFQWVEIKEHGDSLKYELISEDRLYDPNCNPGILIDVEMRENSLKFRFLFSSQNVYDVSYGDFSVISNKHPLYKIVNKVEEAIGHGMV